MPDAPVKERTLPHNLEAERSVLGAILLHNDAFNLAAEVIDSADFFRDAHRRIFDKMVKLAERSGAIDLVTLKDELGRSGELDEVGGPAYIAALVDGVPRSMNVEHYARIIKEKATLRNLIFSANKILTTAYDGEEEADVILDQAENAIFAIADDKVRDGFVSLRELAQSSLDTIEKLHARKELITGVPTGFTDLDEMTSGLQPADLVIIAARPSMGKTSLVLNMAQHVGTKTDMTVGVFSLEMSKEQLFLRLLTSEARIDAHRLRGGFLGERDWGRLSQAIGVAERGEDLHRRHGVHRRPRDARQVPPAGVRARAAPHRRRLHPADAGPRAFREPHARAGVDFPIAQGAGERAVACRSSCCRSSAARRSRAPITGRSSPTCANRAPSSRTPTSSCSSTARISTPTRASRRPTTRAWRSSSSASSATVRPASSSSRSSASSRGSRTSRRRELITYVATEARRTPRDSFLDL